MIKFYWDVHVPHAILQGLRTRGVDVITAQEDGAGELADIDLLRRATSLRRALVTQDNDFKSIAADLQKTETSFSGILFIRPGSETSQVIEHLELISRAEDPRRLRSNIHYIPL